MLSGLVPALPSANPWNPWIDHIMRQQKRFEFQNAALIYRCSGVAAASSKGFSPVISDVKSFLRAFADANNNVDRVKLQENSYIIKSLSNDVLVAFNGKKYVIIRKTKTLLMLVVCTSRAKYQEGCDWLESLHRKLLAKKY